MIVRFATSEEDGSLVVIEIDGLFFDAVPRLKQLVLQWIRMILQSSIRHDESGMIQLI